MNLKHLLLITLTLFLVSACGAKSDPPAQAAPAPAPDTTAVADSLVTAKPLVTFLELGSRTCIPCKMMQPVMKEIEALYDGKVKVTFHDLGDDREIGQRYRIRVMPTQVFLDADGREFFRHEGFYPKDDIKKMLDEHLAIKPPTTN